MKYDVIITPTAEADLAESFAFIHGRSPANAERLIRDILRVVHELEEFAGYGRARESDFLNVELRQKISKSHRIVYELDESRATVTVHFVRHGSRRAAGEPESSEE
jgi:plasmid stabilization system protein ParE